MSTFTGATPVSGASANAVWLLPAGCVLACGAALYMALTSRIPVTPSALVSVVAPILAGLCYSAIGALLIARRASPALGVAMCLVGAIFSATLLCVEYTIEALAAHPGSLPGGAITAWASLWIFNAAFPCGIAVLFLLFPSGRPPSKRWNVLLVALLVLIAVGVAYGMVAPDEIIVGFRGSFLHLANPFGIAALRPLTSALVVVSVAEVLTSVGAMGSVAWRYRRAGGVERAQIRWLALVAAIAAVSLPIAYLDSSRQSSEHFTLTLQNVAFALFVADLSLGLPVAFAVAVLKYRLYDIDVVLSRTLVYGSLAAFITAVYVAVVVGVGTLVGSGGQPNLVLSIVATAIVAVAFQPVRERVQRVANRLVYGKRATPYEVLSHFSEHVAETYAADEALPRMAKVLAEGTGSERATVWLRGDDALRPAAVWPGASSNGAAPAVDDEPVRITGKELPDLPGDRTAAVMHRGELLGALSVAKRPGESLTPVEDKLLADLAAQAGLVLKNVGLTAELLARLDDLRASRQRLVAAQDEERRRLERNLHDGAQQNLVALKVKLGLAESLAEKDPEKARELVAQLKADADEALDTLRDLARGIYPPLLADRGLAGALEAQARKATLPVDVKADGIGRYPQETEAAVYFCVLEALQNVQKYAQASRVEVRISEHEGALTFEVDDDGRGFDPAIAKRGAGLTNMLDRIDALGGSIDVSSTRGRGTRIQGSLPVAAAAASVTPLVGGLPVAT